MAGRASGKLPFLLCAALAACGSESTAPGGDRPDAGEAGPPAYTSEVYSDGAHWLCRPDAPDDLCQRDLDAAVVETRSIRVEPHVVARDAPADCFYVYPTISGDSGPSADLVPGDEEKGVVRGQAARLTAACRLFAPVYRQVTLEGLLQLTADAAARERAYADVLDAWRHYLAHDNAGRGVVLVGHSQGAGVLGRLLREEIDPSATERSRIVAAYLLGSSVGVPDGADVGGDLQNVPLCRRRTDTGCVVSYATYRASAPPPPDGIFGRDQADGDRSACTNPAALAGGRALLSPYFPADPGHEPPVETPWVTWPGLVEGECVDRGGFRYLEITVHGDPADPRPDDVGGDLTPPWGLHLVDVHLAMGDLVSLARDQIAAYVAR